MLQALRPFLIEAMRPISQRLTVHAANLRRFRAAHAVISRRQGQKPPNLARFEALLASERVQASIGIAPNAEPDSG